MASSTRAEQLVWAPAARAVPIDVVPPIQPIAAAPTAAASPPTGSASSPAPTAVAVAQPLVEITPTPAAALPVPETDASLSTKLLNTAVAALAHAATIAQPPAPVSSSAPQAVGRPTERLGSVSTPKGVKLNVLLIGEYGSGLPNPAVPLLISAGKTSVSARYIHGTYSEDHKTTIGGLVITMRIRPHLEPELQLCTVRTRQQLYITKVSCTGSCLASVFELPSGIRLEKDVVSACHHGDARAGRLPGACLHVLPTACHPDWSLAHRSVGGLEYLGRRLLTPADVGHAGTGPLRLAHAKLLSQYACMHRCV